MENKFDTLAKSLADSVSRREALSRLGGGLAGMLLATVGLGQAWGVPGTGKGVDCGNVCNAAFNPTAKATKAQNQRCKQTCQDCQTAGGTTCGLASDGTMGCCSGATPTCCGGVCSDLTSDVSHCGTCTNPCTSPTNGTATCNNGTCGFTCETGFMPSGSQCVPNSVCRNPIGLNDSCTNRTAHVCSEGCGICATTTSGNNICTFLDSGVFACDCSSNADCPAGSACVTVPTCLCASGKACSGVLVGCTG